MEKEAVTHDMKGGAGHGGDGSQPREQVQPALEGS